ncbi:hypothetical protein HanIR_Chr01g0042861 [Helianthus annuus]|nr:hypothetical protein HanIR_Chr01g0042861 [Helianthus annuus]
MVYKKKNQVREIRCVDVCLITSPTPQRTNSCMRFIPGTHAHNTLFIKKKKKKKKKNQQSSIKISND